MATLDTNCLLRWLLNDLPNQAELVETLVATTPELVVPDLVMAEVAFVLERSLGHPRSTVALALETILAQANFRLDREVWSEVLERFRDHPRLSIVDIHLACQAQRRLAGPVLTFDMKFAEQMPGVEVLGRRPG